MPSRQTAVVRRATRADLDGLLGLEEATFASDRISRAQWRRYLANPRATVLVSGRPGLPDAAAVVFYRRNTRAARLYSIAVGAHARGRGLGAALLAAAEADAREHGCAAMRLEVRTDNGAAIALYERRGYVRTAYLAQFYEDRADGWRYVKRLDAGD